jgi:hypothetical protein
MNLIPSNVAVCGASTGSVAISVPGGTGFGFTYNWTGTDNGTSGGSQGANYSMTGLMAGYYIVTVLNGSCGNTQLVTVADANAPNITIEELTSISCPGQFDGVLKVTSTANISAYTFTWSTGDMGVQLDFVNAGYFYVTGTNGTCTTSEFYYLSDPEAIEITGVVGISSINTTVTGGTGSLSYSWSGPGGFTSSSADLNGLASTGNYTLTVTDQNNCTSTQTFNLAFIGIDDLGQAAQKIIKIYPNPAADVINFELTDEVKSMTLVDVSGKTVKSMEVTELNSSMNVGACSNGIYFIQLMDANGTLISNSKISINK